MKKVLSVILTVLLMILVFLSVSFASADVLPRLELHQINAGCANAYLLRVGDYNMMFDTGYNDIYSAPAVREYLAANRLPQIDAIFITHWHPDHAGNMNMVLEAYGTPDTIVYGPSVQVQDPWNPQYIGEYRQLHEDDVVTFGDLTVKCLGPGELEGYGNINKDSLNLLLTYGSRRFMITGDYVRSKDIIDRHEDEIKNIDVFQFPHHGIKTYCVDYWAVRRIAPTYIMIPGAGTKPTQMDFTYKGNVEATWLDYSNGSFAFLTDGSSLDLLTDITPEMLPIGEY